jgi:hypothetical protein
MALTAEELVPEEEETRLLFLIEAEYQRLLVEMHHLTRDALEADPSAFRLDDAATRAMLDAAAERVVLITESTREAIRDVLKAGQAAGLTTQQVADSIAHLLTVTWKSRPETIARTEIAEAQRLAAIDRYAASGLIDRVRIRDGEDDEPCASRNGTTVPLDRAPTLGHPNCTLVLVPVLRAS